VTTECDTSHSGHTASQASFVQLPGLAILRLMSRCNQKCAFCMVAEEIASADEVPYDEAARYILAQPAGTRIEFFGGEPTLHPRFFELLALAHDRGHWCSVATNGRIFSSEKVVRRLAALDMERIYIRSSLYGDSAALHDYYTGCPGSFDQTIRGIGNLVAAGALCQINILILSRNAHRLARTTELVFRHGVPRIKFGNLIGVASCREHAVPLSVVRPHLRQAVVLAERLGLTVTIEKTPVCVASGRIDLMSTERLIGRWPRTYDDEGQCARCLVRRWCEGLDPGYVEAFGYDGLQRMADVPRLAIKGTALASPRPEFLKHICVEVRDGELDRGTLAALYRLDLEVRGQLGQLVAFPRRFVRQ
jgi:pyruvate-formate lyase-activating enzyme